VSDFTDGTQETSSFGKRIERCVERFANSIASITRLFAYSIVICAWFFIGLVAWLATLLCAISILIAVMVFRLVAGLRVERETTRFFVILQFWPDGFTALTQAFWNEEHQKGLQAMTDERTEPSYVFASLRIIYVLVVIYLLVCVYYNANPMTYLLTLPGNAIVGSTLIAVLTLGMSYMADVRKGSLRAPSALLMADATSAEATAGQPAVQGAADSSLWTGREEK
jgi:Flp pilus assembly protein TadB